MGQNLTSYNKDFADAIDKHGIRECGIDRQYIKITSIMHGPSKVAIEGK